MRSVAGKGGAVAPKMPEKSNWRMQVLDRGYAIRFHSTCKGLTNPRDTKGDFPVSEAVASDISADVPSVGIRATGTCRERDPLFRFEVDDKRSGRPGQTRRYGDRVGLITQSRPGRFYARQLGRVHTSEGLR
jgi:hypothetical protein